MWVRARGGAIPYGGAMMTPLHLHDAALRNTTPRYSEIERR